MSGFSAAWLALREPVDHAARNKGLLDAVAARFASSKQISIVDLGCGSGSNLRGVALALPARRQSWTLVDVDSELLAEARARLRDWADEASEAGEELVLGKGDKSISVDFRKADLNTDIEQVAGWRPDLVTAAALFDLASREFIDKFVVALTRHKLPLYTSLTYDGREEFHPPHPLDQRVHRAFLSHQRRDKGFGPSAGPEATEAMDAAFRCAGYQVTTADSPWVLAPSNTDLVGELVEGIAGAASETGAVSPSEGREWSSFRTRAARRADARTIVGHQDLWAFPQEPA